MTSTTPKLPTIIDLLSDPDWYRDYYDGPSWDRHKACLKAAFHEPMSDRDLMLFREVADRDPPKQRVKEYVIIAGRRAGKDSISAAIAVYIAAFSDFSKYVRPGERPCVAILAVDRTQARICWKYVAGLMEHPILSQLIDKSVDGINGQVLELKNGTDITIITNSYRSVRGRTIACCIMDELAFWRDESGANPDAEVYLSLEPALATLPGSMLIMCSTPYKRAGLLYNKFKEHYGQDDDDILVVKGTSRQFNYTLSEATVQRALRRDIMAAKSEYLSEWRDDVGAYIDPALIEAAVDRGIRVRPRLPNINYVCGVDASGGVQGGDSFTCSVTHLEDDTNTVVLDCLIEIQPPFNPDTAVEHICAVLKSYGIQDVVGDRWGSMWVQQAFINQGISYENSEHDRSQIYLNALPLFTSGRVRLLDHPRLVQQFCGLERRVTPSARDRVDHGSNKNARDDCSNAVALGLVLAVHSESPSMAVWRKLGQQVEAERESQRLHQEGIRKQHEEQWAGYNRPFVMKVI